MKKVIYILLMLSPGFQPMFAQNESGGGPAPSLHQHGTCLSPEQRRVEWAHTEAIREQLILEGALVDRRAPGRSVQNVDFAYPIRKSPNSPYRGYYGISNYVDHDASSGLRDYNCTEVTYNGHRGTDYATWPFPWEMMDNNDVEVIAAATGVILEKRDGHFDKSCDWNNKPWNAVYVEHADGSIAWYGHLKKNTLTNKAVGDTVFQGDFLGYIGSSGISTGPHLHFELFDAMGRTLDPYQGSCNNTTASSRWDNQLAHRRPYLIHMQTGDAAPEYGNFCYGQEASNENKQFDPGDKIFLSLYARDYLTSMSTNLILVEPDGNVYQSWSSSPSTLWSLSYWWWSRDLPSNAKEGQWTFEVIFDGQTYSYPFFVGNATDVDKLAGQKISIGPNPAKGFLSVQGVENLDIAYALMDVQGREVKKDQMKGNKIRLDNLSDGVYLLRLMEKGSGQVLNKRILKQ